MHFGSHVQGQRRTNLKLPHKNRHEGSIDAALGDDNTVGDFGDPSSYQILLCRKFKRDDEWQYSERRHQGHSVKEANTDFWTFGNQIQVKWGQFCMILGNSHVKIKPITSENVQFTCDIMKMNSHMWICVGNVEFACEEAHLIWLYWPRFVVEILKSQLLMKRT